MNKINRSGTAIILIGLSILLDNQIVIATRNNSNISHTCNQKNAQDSSVINQPKKDNIFRDTNTMSTTKTVSDVTQTSFWWAAKQFDPFNGKLIKNWFSHPQKQQINLVVNWRLWTLLDYFGRYRFVNQFGTVARKYGYSLNIFNQKDQCLASYKYNDAIVPPKWELNLLEFGRDSLQIEPQQLSNKYSHSNYFIDK